MRNAETRLRALERNRPPPPDPIDLTRMADRYALWSYKAGIGSGAVTKRVLDGINVTPEARAAFNSNPYVAQAALNRVARDEAWASVWGPAREDLQIMRRIIGTGPGWVDRLEAALKSGQLLPVAVGPFLAAIALDQERQAQPPERAASL